MRVCSVPGCPELVKTGKCAKHKAEARRRNINPPNDWAHRQERHRLLPLAIGKPCPMCGEMMSEGEALDLDHTTPRALGNAGIGDRITHARCNRRAGGTLSASLR